MHVKRCLLVSLSQMSFARCSLQSIQSYQLVFDPQLSVCLSQRIGVPLLTLLAHQSCSLFQVQVYIVEHVLLCELYHLSLLFC